MEFTFVMLLLDIFTYLLEEKIFNIIISFSEVRYRDRNLEQVNFSVKNQTPADIVLHTEDFRQ